MEMLKKRILEEGHALNDQVLLVDSFLNHQVDPVLMQAVGEEFARRFADAGITRVATIESSGIAPAVMTALTMRVTLKSKFVHPGDKVLLIDDFLANGEAAFGGIRLLEKAGATVAGVGAVIAKAFQPGLGKLREAGYTVEVLAPVSRMAENVIEFE